MGEKRESLILVKSPTFKDEDAKFTFHLRADIGAAPCAQRAAECRNLGMEPNKFLLVFTHDFETEEAAQLAAAKIIELKASTEELTILKSAKGMGKKLVAYFNDDKVEAATFEGIEKYTAMIGDVALINQYFDLQMGSTRDIKAIFKEASASPSAHSVENFILKLTFSFCKGVVIKTFDVVFPKNPDPTYQHIMKLQARAYGAFHHITYTADLKEPTPWMNKAFHEKVIKPIVAAAQKAASVLTQPEILQLAKADGASSRLLMCVGPLISLEATLVAPKVLDIVAERATPAPAGGPA
jgi:hypothetical protein